MPRAAIDYRPTKAQTPAWVSEWTPEREEFLNQRLLCFQFSMQYMGEVYVWYIIDIDCLENPNLYEAINVELTGDARRLFNDKWPGTFHDPMVVTGAMLWNNGEPVVVHKKDAVNAT